MLLSSYFPEPYNLSFMDWGAIVAEQLAPFGVSAPYNETSWKTWVSALHEVPELVAMNIPRADGFEDWSEWANRFIGAVR